MDSFKNVEFVARGRFATVFKAIDVKTNESVALKKMWVKSSLLVSNPIISSPSVHPYNNYLSHCIDREVQILKLLNNHPNIISLINTFNEDEYMIIVLEYMNIDLHELLQYMKSIKLKFTENQCKYIAKQLFQGLHILHSNNIVHRDLKPANILFNTNGILKIADLGQARIIPAVTAISGNDNQDNDEKQDVYHNDSINKSFSGMIRGSQIELCTKKEDKHMMSQITQITEYQMTNEVGTRWYKSPELLYGTRKYDASIDIWSVGCIIFEILYCSPLFCGETDIDQLCKIFNVLGTINLNKYCDALNLPDFNKIVFNKIDAKELNKLWSNLSNKVIDLIQSCLQFNPKSRISCNDLLKHHWFNNIQNDLLSKSLNNLIETATTQLIQKRKKNNSNKSAADDEVISITSDILSECNLLDLETK